MKLNSVAKAVVAKQIQALVKQMQAQDSDNQNVVPPSQDLKDGDHFARSPQSCQQVQYRRPR